MCLWSYPEVRSNTKIWFFIICSITFSFSFFMLKHSWNHPDKQKKAKRDGLQAICVIGKRFRGDPGQTCYIATADISGITWLHNNYMCRSYAPVWPGSPRNRFPITQIACKPSLFAFFCLSGWFHTCLSIKNENENVIEHIIKNQILVLLLTSG